MFLLQISVEVSNSSPVSEPPHQQQQHHRGVSCHIHPYLFDFLPALVGPGVAGLAVVSAQRGFKQAPLEPRVTERIQIRPAIRSGRFLRGGLGPGPGQSQVLLRSASGQPLLGGLWRQRRFAAQTLQPGARLSFGGGHAPRVILLLGFFEVLPDIIFRPGANGDRLGLCLGQKNAF